MYPGILLTSVASMPSKADRSRRKEGKWIILVLIPVRVSALIWQSYCCKHEQEAFQPQKLVWSHFLLLGILLVSSLPCCLRKITHGAPTLLFRVQRISISSDSSVPAPFIAFRSSRASYSQGRSSRASTAFSKFPLRSPFRTSSISCGDSQEG